MTPDDLILDRHTHRFPRGLYRTAKAIAKARGEKLSTVLRDALVRYVKRHAGEIEDEG